MSMLTSAFAMLGSYYSEANPSLQGEPITFRSYSCSTGSQPYQHIGQRLYTAGDATSLATMDRQIYRIIGKAITLAA